MICCTLARTYLLVQHSALLSITLKNVFCLTYLKGWALDRADAQRIGQLMTTGRAARGVVHLCDTLRRLLDSMSAVGS